MSSKKNILIASLVLASLASITFLGWTGYKLAQIKRVYGAYFRNSPSGFEWTDAGRAWWSRRSDNNALRACYLLGRPLPRWGYVLLVRWFEGAVFVTTWDPHDDSTLLIYRPNPSRPASLNAIAVRLAAQEQKDSLGLKLLRWVDDAPPMWMTLRTEERSPVTGYPLLKNAKHVQLVDRMPQDSGIEVPVKISSETWTLLAFSHQPITPARLQTFVSRLTAPVTLSQNMNIALILAKTHPRGAQELKEMVNFSLAMGRWKKAWYYWHQRSREKRQDFLLYRSFGLDMRAKGQYPPALTAFGLALSDQPSDPTLWRYSADTGMAAHQFAFAAALYKKLLSLHPESIPGALGLAKAYERSGQQGQALGLYESLTKKNPSLAEAWEGKGLVEIELKKNQLGLDDSLKAIQLNPRLPQAQESVCVALTNLKRFDEALAACKLAIDLAPRRASAYVAAGALYFNMRNFSIALQAFQMAEKRDPRSPITLGYEGVVLANLQRFKEATAQIQKALTFDANNPQLHSLLAQLYVKQGDTAGVAREKQVLARLGRTHK